eukprot:5031434-Prymnesium_polylepis.1
MRLREGCEEAGGKSGTSRAPPPRDPAFLRFGGTRDNAVWEDLPVKNEKGDSGESNPGSLPP